MNLFSWLDILSNSPQHASGIDNHEVADAPCPVRRWFGPDTILGNQSLSLNVIPPSLTKSLDGTNALTSNVASFPTVALVFWKALNVRRYKN